MDDCMIKYDADRAPKNRRHSIADQCNESKISRTLDDGSCIQRNHRIYGRVENDKTKSTQELIQQDRMAGYNNIGDDRGYHDFTSRNARPVEQMTHDSRLRNAYYWNKNANGIVDINYSTRNPKN